VVKQNRVSKFIGELTVLFEDASGIDLKEFRTEDSFFDIGMDSLILTQASIQIERRFKVKVSFRALLEDLSNLHALAEHLASHCDEFKEASAPKSQTSKQPPLVSTSATHQASSDSQRSTSQSIPYLTEIPDSLANPELSKIGDHNIANIITLFQAQISMLERFGRQTAVALTSQVASDSDEQKVSRLEASEKPTKATGLPLTTSDEPAAKPFGAIARISKDSSSMTGQQRAFYEDLVNRYTKKTAGSRQHTQMYRGTHADPRVVTGFKPHLKEIIYPIVMKRSKGALLWDIDDNRYVDLTCGFGSNFFGNMPDWLETRLINQIKSGIEIGPQHELAGVVSRKLTNYLGHDRVAFCNTGSEAILGAIRIARTVTGRDKIVAFSGSYHGIIDEVIVRASKSGKSMPAAPGILSNAVGQIVVLDYGIEPSLKTIETSGDTIAAVLVESIQSRRPDFRPKEFIRQLRRICDEKGIVLIFDEIITGFRTGRHGAQGYYEVKADLATYGKVIGGGISIGVIAGKKMFMDALDGGHWNFGDQSVPEVGVTYFAGTFVRHPLALAAIDSVLDFLTAQTDDLAAKLSKKADDYVARVNAIFKKYKAPWTYVNFGSMMKLNASESLGNLELLVYLLRYKGVHTWDGFPNFLTISHSSQDIDHIVQAFEESVKELANAGFFAPFTAPENSQVAPAVPSSAGTNVKMGRDEQGQAMEFKADPLNPGQYIAVVKGSGHEQR
jgi:glutamate-1-semialdehyde aminotransferase/acyl carrier protein